MATGSWYKSTYSNNNNIKPCYSSKSKSKAQRLLLVYVISFISISLGFLPTGVDGKLTITKDCEEIICKSHQYCSQVDKSCRPCQVACDPALGNYDKSVCEKDCQDYLHDLWYMRKSDNETGPSFKEEVFLGLYYKMEEDLRLLKILIGVVIILSTCVMLALFAVMIYFKKIKNRLGCYHADGSSPCENNYYNKKKKLMDLPVIYSNNKVLSLTLPDFHNDEHKDPTSHRSVSCMNNINNSRGGSTPDLVSRSATSLNSSTSLPQENSNTNKSSTSTREMTQSERQQKFRREPSESTLPEYHAYDNPAMVPSPTHM